MEALWRILAPGINLYSGSIQMSQVDYILGNTNMALRLLMILFLTSFGVSLLFYFAGRYINLKHNWQWFTALAVAIVLYLLIIYNQVFENIWYGNPEDAIDLDYAFILSPIIWVIILFIAFSKLWKSIKNFTVFALHTPTFLSK